VSNSNDKTTIAQTVENVNVPNTRKSVPPEDIEKKIKKVTQDSYYFIRYSLIYYNFYRESMENRPLKERCIYTISRKTVMSNVHFLELKG